MSNRDGIVSIGFDYKKELEKMIKDFEAEMNTVSSNTQLSKGMKKQFDNILAEMREFKASMDKELGNLGSEKVSKSSFKSFKQTVENNFKGIREDIDRLDLAISTLNDSMGILDKGIDLSKISNDFKNFENYVTRTNSAVEKLINTLGEQGISLFSFDNRNISDIQSTIRKIDSELKQLDKDTGAKFELFDENEAQAELNRLSVQLVSTLELMENAKKQMENMDTSTDGFKKTRGEYALLQLQAASLNETIEMLYNTTETNGMHIEMDDKSFSMYDKYTSELSENLNNIIDYAQSAKKELSSLIDSQKAPTVKVSSEMNPNSSELATVVTIETTSSELWKKLAPIMQDLQGVLNSNPVIAPVKLVVAPTAVSSVETGNLETSASYSKKYAKVLAQTGEDAVVDLEGVYKKTFTSVMDAAVSYSKETIGKIQEIFDKNLIGVKFDISQEEIDKIQNFVLSNKDGKKIDISGQIIKAKQDVEELNQNIENTAKLLGDTKSKGDVKFDGFDKFTQDLSQSIGKLEELQNILKALQNIEITLAKASGIASITELENQWANVEKRIINATKLDGSFRKNASIIKIASEYQKYVDMGGTNSIAGIDKIKNNKDTIDTIISKANEFAKQDLNNDSVKELSIELGSVIDKFDELIATVKTAANALYKIIKQTGVSELDKQWSSITNKFKSFADESGKINLSKQKKDVEELLVMYQRYVNMGGSRTPFDLTDNLETVSKLDKVYKKLNETKPIDNSSTIKSETESFKQVEQSVESLTKAIGDTKVQAINVEATAMEDAAEREILAINAIVDNLNMIVSKLKEIKGIKIPKIQVESVTSTSPVKTNISSGNQTEVLSGDTVDNLQQGINESEQNFRDVNEVVSSFIDTVRKIASQTAQMFSSGDIYQFKESSAFFNPYENTLLSDVVTGDFAETNAEMTKAAREYLQNICADIIGYFHSHPAKTASFSDKDLSNQISNFINDGIYKHLVIASEEIMELDYSQSNPTEMAEFTKRFTAIREKMVEMLFHQLTTNAIFDSANTDSSFETEFGKRFEESSSELMRYVEAGFEERISSFYDFYIDEIKGDGEFDVSNAIQGSLEISQSEEDFVAQMHLRLSSLYDKVLEGYTVPGNAEEVKKELALYKDEVIRRYILPDIISVYDDFRNNTNDAAKELQEKADIFDQQAILKTLESFPNKIKVFVGSIEDYIEEATKLIGMSPQESMLLTKQSKLAGKYGDVSKYGASSEKAIEEFVSTTVKETQDVIDRITKNFRRGMLSANDMDSAINETLEELYGKMLNSGVEELASFARINELEVWADTDIEELLSKIRLHISDGLVEWQGLQQELSQFANSRPTTTPPLLEGNQTPLSSDPIKDTFQGDAESTGMEKVAVATDEAIQAKKDFATANEGVQTSVDGSKSKLELETALMERLAKSAREAADAKKEFVKANLDVEKNANKPSENLDKESSMLSGHSENAEPSGVKKYKKKGYKAHDTGNHDNEKKVANKKELGVVLKELQTEIIASIDETTQFIKEVTDFYDSADNLVKTQMKVGDKNGNMKTYTTSYSINKDGSATAWTSHITTEKFEDQAKAAKKLAEEKRKLRQEDKKSAQSSVNKALKDQLSAWKQIQKIREKINKSSSSEEISLLNESKKYYQQQYINAGRILKSNTDLYDVTQHIANLDKIRLETNQKIASYIDNQKKRNDNDLLKKIESYSKKLNPYTDNTKYTSDFVDNAKNLKDELENLDITNPQDVARLEEINNEINKIVNASKSLDNKLVKQSSNLAEIISKMKIYRSDNTNMSRTQKAELTALIDSAQKLFDGGKVSAEAIEKIKIAFSGIKANVSETGRDGLNFVGQMTQRIKDINSKFIAQYFSWQDWIRYIRQGVEIVRELDTALTEMRKVSDEPTKSLKEFQKASFEIAKDVGTTAKQIQNSTADWMRLGETLDEASESAKVANILLNVSEFEGIDEATDSLVAMSSAYDELDKMDIVDKLNEVGNNYAISTDGIATALQRSASALKTASNDMDEAIALVTAGNAVVQDPDSVGAGLRTIALRLTGTKEASSELESLGEDTDGVITTVSKLRDTIKSATSVASNGFKGFDILDDNGNYKSTYEILKGISEVYQEIVETDKKTGSNNVNLLLETIAGKNRSNIAASILQNPELLSSVYESSANKSSGSAEEELDKYLDSIDGKIVLFQNGMQEFWYNLLDSDVIKEVVDAGTQLITILGNIVSGIEKLEVLNIIVKPLSFLIDLVANLTSKLQGLSTVSAGLAGVAIFKKVKGSKSGGRSKSLCLIA